MKVTNTDQLDFLSCTTHFGAYNILRFMYKTADNVICKGLDLLRGNLVLAGRLFRGSHRIAFA